MLQAFGHLYWFLAHSVIFHIPDTHHHVIFFHSLSKQLDRHYCMFQVKTSASPINILPSKFFLEMMGGGAPPSKPPWWFHKEINEVSWWRSIGEKMSRYRSGFMAGSDVFVIEEKISASWEQKEVNSVSNGFLISLFA